MIRKIRQRNQLNLELLSIFDYTKHKVEKGKMIISLLKLINFLQFFSLATLPKVKKKN